MTLTLVWAMAENGVIGRSGDLPWSLPDDLARFKKITHGGTVIMGRKTWESLHIQPLPGRTNLVVSRNSEFEAEGATVVSSVEEAVESALSDAFCIGGAQVFAASIDLATHIKVTMVHNEIEGDVYVPPIDWDQWLMTSEEFHPADDRHVVPFSFLSYDRASYSGR